MYNLKAVALLLVLCIYIHNVTSRGISTEDNEESNEEYSTEYDLITKVNYTIPQLNLTSTGMLPDGKDHPCYRQCDGKPMICYYHFYIEWYQTMSKACYDCPFNTTDCNRIDCVVADGLSRAITVVNKKMPGPSIEVCQGDKIRVNVTNDLMGSVTSIHWHGLHQLDTPFMDGVPFVTQCPIQPECHFVYEFYAKQHGTYFWHSHIGLQRGDGVTGALIIRREPSKEKHYNHALDMSENVIQVYDWTREMSVGIYTDHYHVQGDMAPNALLINGRGRFNRTDGNRTTITQAPVFHVTKNFTYQFRFINAQFYFCPVELSVDGHNITIVASDGNDLEPFTAQSLVAYAGERFDFIINTNQTIDNYWIRIRGIMNCEKREYIRQVAVLRYNGAEDSEPNAGQLQWAARSFNSMSVNIENRGEEQTNVTTITMLRSLKSNESDDDTLKKIPDYKLFVSYDLHFKDNPHFNKKTYYAHNQVNRKYSVPMPQLNHISMKLPHSPLLVSRLPSSEFCNSSTVATTCSHNFCKCPHVLSVKLDTVVEVVIIDEGKYFDANHPFHLHGHAFNVVAMKRLGKDTSIEEVKKLDENGKIERNLKNPPIKDTVTVPDGGYTVIRFKANNPGYWLFHCHIEFHAEVGMALVFKVGEHEEMKPVPDQFPTCGHYSNTGNTLKPKVLSPVRSLINLPDGGQIEVVYKPPASKKNVTNLF